MKTILKYKSYLFVLTIFTVLAFLILLPRKTRPVYEGQGFVENPHLARKNKDELKIGVDMYYNPLNPFYETSQDISLMSKLIHRSLFYRDKEGNLVGDLADHYWIENEGKTISVVLKKNQKFKTGREITTKDIIRVFKVLADPSYEGSKSQYVDKLKGYYSYKKLNEESSLGIETDGKYFIKFNFNLASKDVFNIFDFPIVDLEGLDYAYGDISSIEEAEFLKGSDEYFVESYDVNSYKLESENSEIPKNLTIDINPYYIALNRYSSGALDILYKYNKVDRGVSNLSDRLKQYTFTEESLASKCLFVGFNHEDGYFKELEMRQALKNSIDFVDIFKYDKEDQIKILLINRANTNNESEIQNDRSLAQAKNKLKKGNRISIAIHNSLNNVIQNEKALREAFEKEGILLEINYLDDIQMFQIYEGKLKYDLFIAKQDMFMVPSVVNQWIYTKDRIVSPVVIKDYEMIADLEWIAQAFGQDNYEFAIDKWENWFYKNIPYIPLVADKKVSLINLRLKGILINEFVGLDNKDNLRLINNMLK